MCFNEKHNICGANEDLSSGEERSGMKGRCYEDGVEMRSNGDKRFGRDRRVEYDDNPLSNIGCLVIREEIVMKNSALLKKDWKDFLEVFLLSVLFSTLLVRLNTCTHTMKRSRRLDRKLLKVDCNNVPD
jgi:hypothetical protein